MNVSATRVSLIEKLCDHQDNVAWTEFANLYGPVIYAYGLKRGLQSADAPWPLIKGLDGNQQGQPTP